VAWSFGFRVAPEQERQTRYDESTTRVGANLRPQVDAAKDGAFAIIDAAGLDDAKPYQVIMNGDVSSDGRLAFQVSVVQDVPVPKQPD
jgi:hypothetical protein